MALGENAVSGNYDTAIGNYVIANDGYGVALGAGAEARAPGTGYGGMTAIGAQAKALNFYALAVGFQANASGYDAVALGAATDAVDGGIAIGRSASVKSALATAIGYSSSATGFNSIAMGFYAKTEGEDAISLGREASSGSTGSIAVGQGSQAIYQYGVSLGVRTVAQDRGVALGFEANSVGTNTSALGSGSQANGVQATAVGAGSEATGMGTLAFGAFSASRGDYSVALGYSSFAPANQATAIGYRGQAHGVNSTAIGTGTNAGHANSTAVGTGATTTRANQVMLGGTGSSVVVADIASSTAAQQGPVDVVTIDAAGTLGRQRVATAGQVETVRLGMDHISAVTDAQFSTLGGRVTALESQMADIGFRLEDTNDMARGGIAAAMAFGGTMIVPDSTVSVSLNASTFQGEQGFAGSVAARVAERVYVSGGITGSTVKDTTGARAGVAFGF
jgi:hypothetical protein